jgi:hypothetical protein
MPTDDFYKCAAISGNVSFEQTGIVERSNVHAFNYGRSRTNPTGNSVGYPGKGAAQVQSPMKLLGLTHVPQTIARISSAGNRRDPHTGLTPRRLPAENLCPEWSPPAVPQAYALPRLG